MFYYVNGTVAELEAGLAVIDCGGVGYACATTNYTLSQLKKGERAKLYTYLNVREDDKEFIANFYKYAFVGVMLDWVKNDMKEDPKQIIDRLSTLMHGNVSAALERFSIS